MAEYKVRSVQELLGSGDTILTDTFKSIKMFNDLVSAKEKREWSREVRAREGAAYTTSRFRQMADQIEKYFRDGNTRAAEEMAGKFTTTYGGIQTNNKVVQENFLLDMRRVSHVQKSIGVMNEFDDFMDGRGGEADDDGTPIISGEVNYGFKAFKEIGDKYKDDDYTRKGVWKAHVEKSVEELQEWKLKLKRSKVSDNITEGVIDDYIKDIHYLDSLGGHDYMLNDEMEEAMWDEHKAGISSKSVLDRYNELKTNFDSSTNRLSVIDEMITDLKLAITEDKVGQVNDTEEQLLARQAAAEIKINNLEVMRTSTRENLEAYTAQIKEYNDRRGDWDLGFGDAFFTPEPEVEKDVKKLTEKFNKVKDELLKDKYLTQDGRDQIDVILQSMTDDSTPADLQANVQKILNLKTETDSFRVKEEAKLKEEAEQKVIEDEKALPGYASVSVTKDKDDKDVALPYESNKPEHQAALNKFHTQRNALLDKYNKVKDRLEVLEANKTDLEDIQDTLNLKFRQLREEPVDTKKDLIRDEIKQLNKDKAEIRSTLTKYKTVSGWGRGSQTINFLPDLKKEIKIAKEDLKDPKKEILTLESRIKSLSIK